MYKCVDNKRGRKSCDTLSLKYILRRNYTALGNRLWSQRGIKIYHPYPLRQQCVRKVICSVLALYIMLGRTSLYSVMLGLKMIGHFSCTILLHLVFLHYYLVLPFCTVIFVSIPCTVTVDLCCYSCQLICLYSSIVYSNKTRYILWRNSGL